LPILILNEQKKSGQPLFFSLLRRERFIYMDKERTIRYVSVCGSTNDEIKSLVRASAAPVWDVLCAGSQTGGRGRRGKRFFSPPGGIYFTAAFPLAGDETNAPFLTLLAGLAVCRTLETACGARFSVKWPNDIYTGGKKLCGILTELVSGPAGNTAAVGVGLNAFLPEEEIPSDLRGVMTSLSAEGLPVPEKEAFIRAAVSLLDTFVYEEGALCGGSAPFAREINRRSYLYGRRIAVRGAGVFTGPAGEITPDGALTVHTDEGDVQVKSGEVVCLP
jgi:BirA family biotin operon repressor/biotin-[acetyl-CoA-carboxylase] ligase